MSLLALCYLLLSLLVAAVLTLWLTRPGPARAEVVWGTAALLPLLAALAVALGQSRLPG
ncbi:hypothetical protein [Deinococcus navajonensis]|uniref:Uncharacterized protein n=1 Tax=Deinococcus navajonensis TaxID=309884 RepID=A0ABV8XTV4_9DEIO